MEIVFKEASSWGFSGAAQSLGRGPLSKPKGPKDHFFRPPEALRLIEMHSLEKGLLSY